MPYPNLTEAEWSDLVALLASAGGLHFQGDEVLRVMSYNAATGVTITVAGRFRQPNGRVIAFKETHTPNTDRTLKTDHFQLGAGTLLNLQAYASAGAPRRGQCYVGIEISRGTTAAREPLATLVKDYVCEGAGIAWPGSSIRSSVEGPGVIRSITGTDPAAGAEISETVPTNARWRLLAVRFTLVTDATVANRTPALVLDDGTNDFARLPASGATTAGLTAQHTWAAVGATLGTNGALMFLPDPIAAMLMGGFRIRTVTTNLQAGDNYGAPQLLVEEWIED